MLAKPFLISRLTCLSSVEPFIARFLGDSSFLNALAIGLLSLSQRSDREQEVVSRLLPLILDTAASHFELQKYFSSRESQHSAALVGALYQQILQSNRKKAFELLDVIQAQAIKISLDTLGQIFPPLLEQMMLHIGTGSPEICEFVRSMMALYLTRIVQEKPEKPKDWSRSDYRVNCNLSSCSFCPSLRDFLVDPDKEGRMFDSRKNYPHLQQQTRSLPFTKYETSIDRFKRVVIVKKILKAWENDHEWWQRRASKAQEVFRQLPQTALKQCLGDQYEEILGLR